MAAATLGLVTGKRGRFITIEGPDGSGKTTQVDRLAERLRAAGRPVVVTREPGGTRLGEQLREILLARHGGVEPTDALTDAFLFEAARRHLVRQVIRPALEDEAIVVCGRYSDSTFAYQGFGAGVPLETLRALDEAATEGLRPDLTILLDLPAEAGLARVTPDDVTRFEAEHDLAFHRRVRDGFLRLAAEAPERFVIVDATRSADEVATEVWRAVEARLGAPASEPNAPVRAHEPVSADDAVAPGRPVSTVEDDDRQVLARVANGELNALEALYDRYRAMAYSIALRVTGDASLAEDVLQDAFLGAWRHAGRYAEGRGSVKTWLLAIVHHRAVDAVRRRRPTNALPETEDVTPAALTAPDLWGEVAADLDADTVRAALDVLPEVQREAIELAYFGGLTQQEIATRTGAPLGTVKGRMRLALLAMRRHLLEQGAGP